MSVVRTPEGRRKSILLPEDAQALLELTLQGMSADDLAALQGVMEIQGLDQSLHKARWAKKPVSMEQFLDDPYYLGESCKTLFPALRQDMITLFDGNYREVVLCLHPDTPIPMVDGTILTIHQLAQRWLVGNEDFWIYALGEDGRIVPSLATQPRCTGEDDYFRVTMGDGNHFVANARHQMVMGDGTKEMVRNMRRGHQILSRDGGLSSVASILPAGRGLVYCMTVPNYSNFAILLRDENGDVRDKGLISGNTGGIGVGKTMGFSLCMARVLYELSCLVSPQESLGLSKATELAIPLISKNLRLSRRVLRSALDEKIRLSPYFMREFTPMFRSEYTQFPGNIRVVESSYGSDAILGTTVISAVMDETNFPPGKQKQVIATSSGVKKTEANFDIVEKIYSGILTRMKSRLMKGGGYMPGMVILTSSAGTVNSFIDRRVREAEDDPLCFVRDHTQWTVKPGEYRDSPKFWVLCGSSSTQSRILKDGEEIDEEELDKRNAVVIEVPEEWRDDFERNLEDSLRDIAGISTMAISQYIQRVEAIDECVRHDRVHPFGTTEWMANVPTSFQWHQMVKEVQRKNGAGTVEVFYQPLRNPSAPRWIHIDPSLSGDNTGFCMMHISHWVNIDRRMPDGQLITELSPNYVVDFVLRVCPPPSEQIYLGDIRQLVYDLQNHGYHIMGVSTDKFQSADTLQMLSRNGGLRTMYQSVDTTTGPYDAVKAAIYEKRIEFYPYDPLFAELKSLEYDREKGKIDHPKAGEKDIADAVAGAVWGLAQHITEMPLERRLLDVEEPVTMQEAANRLVFGDKIVGNVEPDRVVAKHQAEELGSLPVPFMF